MTELNRAQLQAWEASLQMASSALDDTRAGPARLRGRLRNTIASLRASVEAVLRLVEVIAGLRREVLAEQQRVAAVIEQLPIPYLLTAADGTILRVNHAATMAVNVSARWLVGRNLLVFFDDRDAWLQMLEEMTVSRVATRRAGRLRPRERLQTSIVANLSVADTCEGPAIQWFLSSPPHDTPRARVFTERPGATLSTPPSS